MKTDEVQRRQAKTREQRFVNVLIQEFRFAPKIATAILSEAEACLMPEENQLLRPGQVRQILLQREAKHGQPIQETPTKEVTWTVDDGRGDAAYGAEHGGRALRQRRMQRLATEALAQEAVATQEDLAWALHVSVRTIKRDCAALERAGILLPLRGKLQNIGRGQSHKVGIITRWLHGETYDQLQRHTQHSLGAIRRYIQTFVRVVDCQRRGLEATAIAHILQISRPLVQEYLHLYQQHNTSFCRQRLDEQIARLTQAAPPPKRRIG